MNHIPCGLLLAAAMTAAATPVFAHATLEVQQAPADTYYKATMRIGHGCEGSPTLVVKISLPPEVSAVKPMPKPGWELKIVKAKLDKPFRDSHGREVTERVSEVHWTGGRLLDEHYDEFALQVRLPDTPGATLYFPTVQECERGVHRWIEIPAPGKTRSDYKEPAPHMMLTPKP
jgi:periplasmic copper chaperone A